MIRTLAAAEINGQTVVYDPCTGQIRRVRRSLPTGRRRVDDERLADWPEIHPADLHHRWPVSVCWSPIVRCNLSCPYCLDDTSVPESGRASRASTATTLASAGILGVDISGGEPLLLPDLAALATQLSAGGKAVSVTTNGWHLARRAEELAGAVDAVRVSIDSPDAARHDATRGSGSFHRAVAGVTACERLGLPVQIQSVLRAGHTGELQGIVELAGALRVHGVTFLQLLPIGAATARTPGLVDDQAAHDLIAALARPPGLHIRLRARDAAGNFTVIRADGRVWRNQPDGLGIEPTVPLTESAGLLLTHPDGSA